MIQTIWAKLQRGMIAVLVWSATAPPENNDREAIWSVPHTLRHVYFVILSALWWPQFAEKFAEQSIDFQPTDWRTITELWRATESTLNTHTGDLAAYGLATAILTLIFTQTGAYIKEDLLYEAKPARRFTDSALSDSTLMTSAPWSERIRVAEGLACIQVTSSTLIPRKARPC